jgi:hypothetical protein
MKYFVTYHNEEKMGPYENEPALFILTSKPVNDIVGSYVFLVLGKGKSPKSYELGAAFKATKILTASEPSYLYRVEGEGIYIEKYRRRPPCRVVSGRELGTPACPIGNSARQLNGNGNRVCHHAVDWGEKGEMIRPRPARLAFCCPWLATAPLACGKA